MRKISVWCCGRYLLSFFLRNSYHAVPFVCNDTLVAIWINPQFYCITVYYSPTSIFSALLQFKSIKPIFNNTELRVMLPYSTRWRYCQCDPLLREAPLNLSPPLCGHCPFGGWGLNPCPDGLGHFFREEFSKFKRAFASFWGGLNPCPDGLGH